MATRIIYTGRDTNIKYQLLDQGQPKDLSNLSKIDLIFSSTVKVTGTIGTTTPLDFATTSTELVLKFGAIIIPSGSYPSIKVVVYDADNPNGLIWGEIALVVRDNPFVVVEEDDDKVLHWSIRELPHMTHLFWRNRWRR